MSSPSRSELIEQLKAFAPDGLPREWFVAAAEASKPSPAISQENATTEDAEDTEGSQSSEIVSQGGGPNLEARMTELSELRTIAESCVKCRLCETRNKVVFGTGRTDSPLIAFVGEGPGADEDRTGEPFVGRAGALLTAAITKGLGMKREDVYICNVVKCRPPENRAPLPDEVASCNGYLFRQLELIQPKVIVTLGQPAQLALSGVSMGITKLRGRWLDWRGIPLMPTFHPAYILRNAAVKKEFWEDLQEVMRKLGLKSEGKIS